ncbi:MAG: protein kinase [Phycisphaerae bacterium]
MGDILTKLAAGTASDDELLGYARGAMAEDERLECLRASWPTDKLPIIDDYYCVARLGQGASGVVFKALALRGEPVFVALKLLQFTSKEAEERFREREVKILSALNCPHVARCLDSGSTGGTMYLVTELVDGQALDEYLIEHTYNLEEKLGVFQRVCMVVAGLHAEGVIHRDLKPKHVLVDEQGWPWIVDFGLSAVRSEDWPTRVRHAQTELGHILGTVKYMSPEQAWGGLLQIDHRTDIWALGIMLYEIATDGDYPYELDPVGEMTGHDALLHRIQTEVPKRPRISSAQNADALATLISRCLAHEPDRRIDSAATLAGDLGRCLALQPIHTRRLPFGYRLQRIAIGLAAHWRMGLWFSTVSVVLVLLFVLSLVFGVRWRTAGEDYGKDTRQALLAADQSFAGEGIVIVGVFDDSIRAVPALADSNGIRGVTQDIRSWRAVHGRLMERFARACPRVVVWDYIFHTPQPGDGGFVRGVRALQQAGVPVALAVRGYKDNGRPDLSPQLFDPIADFVRHGLILAHDMVLREGELVMALRRNDHVYPALALSGFAAVVYPDYKMVVDWQDLTKTIRLIHHPRAGSDEFPTVDRVGLTTVYTTSTPRLATREGDVLGCKAFALAHPDHWSERTVAYERMLTANDEELTDLIGGKIVIVGDLRTPHPFLKRDRHRVRYGTEIIDDVPGCYLMADALSGLLANRYLRSETPLTVSAFVGVAIFAFLACLVPPKLSVSKQLGSRRARGGVVLVLLVGSIACALVLLVARSRFGVYTAMLGTAICLAMAASFAIEFARNRHRLPVIG